MPFIFFLTLDESLPGSFYVFDRLLKDAGFILVPVRVDQLQKLVASTEQNHVMVLSCVTNFKEYRQFNDKVRGILKYVLKSRRLTFLSLSSFSKLNDTRMHSLSKNYFFIKNPVDAQTLVARMTSYHEMKSEKSEIWPGGHRVSVSGAA